MIKKLPNFDILDLEDDISNTKNSNFRSERYNEEISPFSNSDLERSHSGKKTTIMKKSCFLEMEERCRIPSTRTGLLI